MSNPIFSMFANSPFQPLQEHMSRVNECTSQLDAFFKAVAAEDWEKAKTVQVEINRLEEEADVLKREIRLKLPDGLFMPVPRTDLIDLLGKQDRIANKSKDIAGLMIGRKMAIPSGLQEKTFKLVHCSIQVVQKAHQIIEELDELVETGFRGHQVSKVEKLIFELDDIEDEADSFERDVRANLFTLETNMNAVEVMFLYKIIDWIGEVANRAQTVGHRLHLMLAR